MIYFLKVLNVLTMFSVFKPSLFSLKQFSFTFVTLYILWESLTTWITYFLGFKIIVVFKLFKNQFNRLLSHRIGHNGFARPAAPHVAEENVWQSVVATNKWTKGLEDATSALKIVETALVVSLSQKNRWIENSFQDFTIQFMFAVYSFSHTQWEHCYDVVCCFQMTSHYFCENYSFLFCHNMSQSSSTTMIWNALLTSDITN